MNTDRTRKLAGLERIDEAVASRKVIQSLQKISKDILKLRKDINIIDIANVGEKDDIIDLLDDLAGSFEDLKVEMNEKEVE